jgi:hypothetical protein
MSTKNLIAICIFLYLITVTVGLLFWPTVYRYENLSLKGHMMLGRINRLSGQVRICDMTTGDWVSAGEIDFPEQDDPRRRTYGRGF